MQTFNPKPFLKNVLLWGGCLTLLTIVFKNHPSLQEPTSVAMVYLLVVVASAYFSNSLSAIFTSVASFFLINYFFIEPRFTFQVASLQSWLLLITFLIVAFTISSSIKQLKDQKNRAVHISEQAQFFQSLAEAFSIQPNSLAILEIGCKRISNKLAAEVAVVRLGDHGEPSTIISQTAPFQIHEASLRSAIDASRIIGMETSDWPDLNQWVMPFGRFQTPTCVLIVDKPPLDNSGIDLTFISLVCNQFSEAYYRYLGQEQLMQAESRAQEEAFKKSMLTSLSHDMRTPLTAILGSANAMADDEVLLNPAQKNALIDSIRSESEYLIQSSENILALVKLNSGGKDALNLDWQFPEEIVSNVVSRYQSRKYHYAVTFTAHHTGSFIKADALLLAQALANLIDNANKWHRGQTPIEVSLSKSNESIAISVSNQGKGFPKGFCIEPFNKNASSRGFGLGLVIVRDIVEAHQGKLIIDSAPEKGATVTMYFPIKTPAEST
jgi:two-component system, OmpR family, sensor histidine kinase KdpD